MGTKQILKMTVIGLVCIVMGATVGFADVTNVALDKPVTLNGVFFTGGWGGGSTVSADTVVDDIFFSRGHQWDLGPVWWDSTGDNTGQSIVIDLEGVYVIESFIVQADDNDAYKLYYWDIESSDWVLAWDVPNYDITGDPPVDNWGMQTRPNPDDDNERYVLASTITTSALKIEGNTSDSADNYFSVSEVQAFGSPVLEATKELTDISDFIDEDPEDGIPDLDIDGYPMVPMHTEIWFEMEITVTNNDPSATIEDVIVKDRLGGDLRLMGYAYPFGTIVSYSTKGNSDKFFISWEVGDLAPLESKTLTLFVCTDVNPGQGKKSEPINEYTSSGVHELNSGANAKGMLGDMQVSDSSESIYVNAVEIIED